MPPVPTKLLPALSMAGSSRYETEERRGVGNTDGNAHEKVVGTNIHPMAAVQVRGHLDGIVRRTGCRPEKRRLVAGRRGDSRRRHGHDDHRPVGRGPK